MSRVALIWKITNIPITNIIIYSFLVTCCLNWMMHEVSQLSHRSSKGDLRQHHRVVVCLNVEPACLPALKGYPRRSGEVNLSLVREEQLKRGVAAQRLWAYHHLHVSMVQSTERMHELPLSNYPWGGELRSTPFSDPIPERQEGGVPEK